MELLGPVAGGDSGDREPARDLDPGAYERPLDPGQRRLVDRRRGGDVRPAAQDRFDAGLAGLCVVGAGVLETFDAAARGRRQEALAGPVRGTVAGRDQLGGPVDQSDAAVPEIGEMVDA